MHITGENHPNIFSRTENILNNISHILNNCKFYKKILHLPKLFIPSGGKILTAFVKKGFRWSNGTFWGNEFWNKCTDSDVIPVNFSKKLWLLQN